jgi:hypothetical protein
MATIVERFVEEQHLPSSRDPREVAQAVGRALSASRPD